jgi:hypothetical protein
MLYRLQVYSSCATFSVFGFALSSVGKVFVLVTSYGFCCVHNFVTQSYTCRIYFHAPLTITSLAESLVLQALHFQRIGFGLKFPGGQG